MIYVGESVDKVINNVLIAAVVTHMWRVLWCFHDGDSFPSDSTLQNWK